MRACACNLVINALLFSQSLSPKHGAGPVGLVLAIDLAWRGMEVTVLEIRHAGEPPNVMLNRPPRWS